jgi:hypothetical protein
MDTLRSRTSKYEIVRVNWGMLGFSSYKFFVLRDGREIGGPYSDYQYAVDIARKDGAR